MSETECLGLSTKSISNIINQMRNPHLGLVVKNRVYRFKTYERCFLASEAVEWLRNNFLFTKEDSITLLKHIEQIDIFEHVTQGHNFQDGYLFFRFNYPKKVVVLGGGIGGTIIAKSLENQFKVTLVDKKDFFEYTPGRISSISKPLYLENVKKEYTKFLNSTFVQGNITQVNLRHVVVQNQDKEIQIDFDYLVLATGCIYNKRFLDILTDRIVDIKENLSYPLMLQSNEIAVLGGGPCGVEIATTLAQTYPYKKIYLISRDLLLKRFERAHDILEDYFSKNLKNLKFMKLNVVDIYQKDETVILQGDHKESSFKFDMVFLATGYSSNCDFLRPAFNDYLNKFGHCKVNQYFQLISKNDNQPNSILKNIFAVGDVTALKEDLLASNTLNHLKYAIENIKSLESDCKFRPYVPLNGEMILSLGDENSLVIQNGISKISGKMDLKKKQIQEVNVMNFLK